MSNNSYHDHHNNGDNDESTDASADLTLRKLQMRVAPLDAGNLPVDLRYITTSGLALQSKHVFCHLDSATLTLNFGKSAAIFLSSL